MIWTLAIMGYLAVGLLLMSFMCPFWNPLEKMLGAIIWPVSVIIGIFFMIKESRDTRTDDLLLLFLLQTTIYAVAKKAENEKEVPKT